MASTGSGPYERAAVAVCSKYSRSVSTVSMHDVNISFCKYMYWYIALLSGISFPCDFSDFLHFLNSVSNGQKLLQNLNCTSTYKILFYELNVQYTYV